MITQRKGGGCAILVADDDEGLATSLTKVLQQRYPCVYTPLSAAEAAAILARERNICMALVDLVMPLTDGLSLLDLVRQSHPDVTVILMTGCGTTEAAAEAIGIASLAALVQEAMERNAEIQASPSRLRCPFSATGNRTRPSPKRQRIWSL
jgi:DNA-binding NtrC family response regulator